MASRKQRNGRLVSLVPAVLMSMAVAPTVLHAEDRPAVKVLPASRMEVPGVELPPPNHEQTGYVDCNSPAHWDGDTLYMFFSAGHPHRSQGKDFAHLSRPSASVTFDNQEAWNQKQQGARWIEATCKADDGKLLAWYHNEPHPSCGKQELTAPRIGQMVSTDNGLNWKDQGLILEAPADSLACQTQNRYFTGGNGDFCVVPDLDRRYLYLFISTYNREPAEQGVAVARMRFADSAAPIDRVFKWYKSQWSEPGLGGKATPIFPADWHGANVDAYWGPSIHWNSYLKQWVMLLNRAKDKEWAQEGIYICFNRDIADPAGWSRPLKILDGGELEKSRWYPQVMGLDASKKETDKLAGQRARLFVAGLSKWELLFLRPGETNPAK